MPGQCAGGNFGFDIRRARADWADVAAGNFGFGISEHIDLGIKYDPSTGIFGMDFYIQMERPGYRVARRRKQQTKVCPAPQRTSGTVTHLRDAAVA